VEVAVLTLFPRMVAGPLAESLLGKAQEKGLLRVRVVDIRDFAQGKHRVTDDVPYGGGAGMVMKPEPLVAAIEAARSASPGAHVLLLTPQGARFDQRKAEELARRERLVLACGRYEGVDERVATHLADEELSIGDYVLAGGEAAALVVIDAVTRTLPGVVGEPESVARESFEDGLLDHPHFTRPESFRGMRVPDVLLSGNHGEIERWRKAEADRRTRRRRPDLST
jgi:tRNA (guanine37-N1)-methyltransferase